MGYCTIFNITIYVPLCVLYIYKQSCFLKTHITLTYGYSTNIIEQQQQQKVFHSFNHPFHSTVFIAPTSLQMYINILYSIGIYCCASCIEIETQSI